MQVVEKSGGGLSRVYGVTVPLADLGAKLDAKIAELTPRMNLKGFRPGKVPPAHVKRIYGKSLMGEVIEQTLSESSQQVLDEQKLRVAAQPDLQPQGDMEQVLAGREDLRFDLNVEVMPDFDPIDVSGLSLTRPVYKPTDAEVGEALDELVKQNRTFEPRGGKSPKAKDGDQVVIDFIGRIDGEAFDGGTATDAPLVLGSGQFIPGFEEQLVGAAPGDSKIVKVTFPEEYSVERLKGQPAEFEITVKEVREPKEGKADDELAQRLGLGDLDALKAALQSNLEQQYGETSRFKLKRALLDKLDTAHDFPLPPRMVDAEFEVIWQQVEQDRAQGGTAPEDEGKTDDELKTEYRKIAERRVRLGLILAEIGQRNNVTVTDQELTDAMRQEAMRYGAQAQQIFDMLRSNNNAKAQMRAPIYEEKVVDLILGRAQVDDKVVSKDELMAEDDLPEGYGEEAKPAKKAAAKPAKAKAAKAEAAEEAPAAEAPAPEAKAEKAAKAAPAKAAKAKAAPAAEEAPAKPAKKAAKPKA
ncbi:MAG TPA: trigger factor [Caulobacteraceae bacterium]